MKLTKKMIDAIENQTNCGVNEEDDYYSIYVDNSCGEDFTIEINKGESEVEDIISYCDNFDSDEHFRMWFGAGRGEPDDARTLLDNCEEIDNNLTQLSCTLKEYLK